MIRMKNKKMKKYNEYVRSQEVHMYMFRKWSLQSFWSEVDNRPSNLELVLHASADNVYVYVS